MTLPEALAGTVALDVPAVAEVPTLIDELEGGGAVTRVAALAEACAWPGAEPVAGADTAAWTCGLDGLEADAGTGD